MSFLCYLETKSYQSFKPMKEKKKSWETESKNEWTLIQFKLWIHPYLSQILFPATKLSLTNIQGKSMGKKTPRMLPTWINAQASEISSKVGRWVSLKGQKKEPWFSKQLLTNKIFCILTKGRQNRIEQNWLVGGIKQKRDRYFPKHISLTYLAQKHILLPDDIVHFMSCVVI